MTDKDKTKSKRKAEDASKAKSKKPKIVKEETIIVEDQHVDKYRETSATEDIPDYLKLTSLGLAESTLKSLKERKVTQLFPIQAAAFSHVIKGYDLLARARTGTGKTLAFSLPIVEVLKKKVQRERGRSPRALIMAPTRELAIQVHKELNQICSGELATTCVYGGAQYGPQEDAFYNGVDIVVGTPGRLIDHIERRNLLLDSLEFVCLDEADQMLDIGFAEAMEKILELVKQQSKSNSTYQTLLFSATMPDWIKQAVQKYMKPDKIVLDLIGKDKQKTSATVKHYCLPSRYQNRADILGDIIAVYGRGNNGRTIVFVETKAEASELALNEKLVSMGGQTLHGDIAQKQRETTMQGFRDGKFSCLITTNVCARGVDIPEVDLVINCEPPSDVESYIHRSGRTGRAGRSGVCITFFKQAQEHLVTNISRRAGVEFVKIAAPQPKDIIGSRAAQNLDELEKVDPLVFPYFTDAAKKFLDFFEGDSQRALECAIAMICNTTSPLPNRSLLTANDGYITVLFTTEQVIRNVGYIKSITQKKFPGLKYEDTVGWRCTADMKGVVVDITEKKIKIKEDAIYIDGIKWVHGRGVTLCIPTELPELQPSYNSNPSSLHGNFRGNSRGRGSNSFRGGSKRGTYSGTRRY
jgi:ATP-dependent RNA helicase DDX21